MKRWRLPEIGRGLLATVVLTAIGVTAGVTAPAGARTAGVATAGAGVAGTDQFDPLTLSPVDSGQDPAAGAGFGAAVATGDFNHDGFQDVAIGSPQGRTGTAGDVASGTVTVFLNGVNGPGTGKVLRQSMWGAADEAGDGVGSSLATGDFNRDGYTDLAVGTPGEAIGTVQAGAAAVFYGSSAGLTTAVGIDEEEKARFPGTETGLLHQAGYLSPEQVSEYGGSLLQLWTSISLSRATTWRAGGARVYAWTVDTEAGWAKMAAERVDAIITNSPIAYRQWADQQCL
jgi:hypothetical protein